MKISDSGVWTHSGAIEALTSDQLCAGVLVDLCHVNDGASLLGVAQRAEALLHVAARGAQRGDHGCLGVAAETLPQQPEQRDVRVITGRGLKEPFVSYTNVLLSISLQMIDCKEYTEK